jgi:hypothetical protein
MSIYIKRLKKKKTKKGTWSSLGRIREHQKRIEKKRIPQIQPWLTFLTRIWFGKHQKATKASSS